MPWKRLTAKGAVIVASILLASWVDAWWDTRQGEALLDEFDEIPGLMDPAKS